MKTIAYEPRSAQITAFITLLPSQFQRQSQKPIRAALHTIHPPPERTNPAPTPLRRTLVVRIARVALFLEPTVQHLQVRVLGQQHTLAAPTLARRAVRRRRARRAQWSPAPISVASLAHAAILRERTLAAVAPPRRTVERTVAGRALLLEALAHVFVRAALDALVPPALAGLALDVLVAVAADSEKLAGVGGVGATQRGQEQCSGGQEELHHCFLCAIRGEGKRYV